MTSSKNEGLLGVIGLNRSRGNLRSMSAISKDSGSGYLGQHRSNF
jgi:hypothetical protein